VAAVAARALQRHADAADNGMAETHLRAARNTGDLAKRAHAAVVPNQDAGAQMSSRLELYHWEPNTYFLKPLIALAEKAAPFVSHWFDPLRLEQLAPGFPRNTESALQLEREGPILVHGDMVISSSFFMLEYIAQALPGMELLPGDAFAH